MQRCFGVGDHAHMPCAATNDNDGPIGFRSVLHSQVLARSVPVLNDVFAAGIILLVMLVATTAAVWSDDPLRRRFTGVVILLNLCS